MHTPMRQIQTLLQGDQQPPAYGWVQLCATYGACKVGVEAEKARQNTTQVGMKAMAHRAGVVQAPAEQTESILKSSKGNTKGG